MAIPSSVIKRFVIAGIVIPIVLICFTYKPALCALAAFLCWFGMEEFILLRTCIIWNTQPEVTNKVDQYQLPPKLRPLKDRLHMWLKQILAVLLVIIPFIYYTNETVWLFMMFSYMSGLITLTMFGLLRAPAKPQDKQLGFWDSIQAPLMKDDLFTFCLDVLGIFYIGGGFSMAPILLHYDPLFLLMILFSNWLSDAFAMFFGKNFGKHKLHERLSPNKTVEGAVGAILGAIFNAHFTRQLFIWLPLQSWLSLPAHYVLPSMTWFTLNGLFIGICSIIGDLVESYLKRVASVKDSGNLFREHGGVLDRVDGLIFTFPIMYTLYKLF